MLFIYTCEGFPGDLTVRTLAVSCVIGPGVLWDPSSHCPPHWLLQHTSLQAYAVLGSWNILFPWLECSFFRYGCELFLHFVSNLCSNVISSEKRSPNGLINYSCHSFCPHLTFFFFIMHITAYKTMYSHPCACFLALFPVNTWNFLYLPHCHVGLSFVSGLPWPVVGFQ